jgi:hypothetical protein
VVHNLTFRLWATPSNFIFSPDVAVNVLANPATITEYFIGTPTIMHERPTVAAGVITAVADNGAASVNANPVPGGVIRVTVPVTPRRVIEVIQLDLTDFVPAMGQDVSSGTDFNSVLSSTGPTARAVTPSDAPRFLQVGETGAPAAAAGPRYNLIGQTAAFPPTGVSTFSDLPNQRYQMVFTLFLPPVAGVGANVSHTFRAGGEGFGTVVRVGTPSDAIVEILAVDAGTNLLRRTMQVRVTFPTTTN